MLSLPVAPATAKPLTLLCLGAHCDDIEIGCGGLLLTLAEQEVPAIVHWVVFSGSCGRAEEARASATALLNGSAASIDVHDFPDGELPHCGPAVKAVFERLKRDTAPDVILTHHTQDLHQDHALIATMTRNTFRNHLVLEYEIPKYDGDLGRPNLYFPLSEQVARRKAEHIYAAFPSQQNRRWFRPDTFLSLARLRGIESNAPGDYAEGFHVPKAVLSFSAPELSLRAA